MVEDGRLFAKKRRYFFEELLRFGVLFIRAGRGGENLVS